MTNTSLDLQSILVSIHISKRDYGFKTQGVNLFFKQTHLRLVEDGLMGSSAERLNCIEMWEWQMRELIPAPPTVSVWQFFFFSTEKKKSTKAYYAAAFQVIHCISQRWTKEHRQQNPERLSPDSRLAWAYWERIITRNHWQVVSPFFLTLFMIRFQSFQELNIEPCREEQTALCSSIGSFCYSLDNASTKQNTTHLLV